MSEEDLKINAKARKILVEHNLDLSLLGVSTTSGTVTVRGEVRKLSGRELSDLDIAKLLGVLESVMLRTKGVKRVTFAIRGWKKAKGKWSKS